MLLEPNLASGTYHSQDCHGFSIRQGLFDCSPAWPISAHRSQSEKGHRRLRVTDSRLRPSTCSFWVNELSRDSAINHQLLPTDEGCLLIVAEKADSLGYICWLPRLACVHSLSTFSLLATASQASSRRWFPSSALAARVTTCRGYVADNNSHHQHCPATSWSQVLVTTNPM